MPVVVVVSLYYYLSHGTKSGRIESQYVNEVMILRAADFQIRLLWLVNIPMLLQKRRKSLPKIFLHLFSTNDEQSQFPWGGS